MTPILLVKLTMRLEGLWFCGGVSFGLFARPGSTKEFASAWCEVDRGINNNNNIIIIIIVIIVVVVIVTIENTNECDGSIWIYNFKFLKRQGQEDHQGYEAEEA